ncbi:MAG TPA: ABC transporter ATP-binding protein [Ilumatobacter sp.]|nr:ABC transporter ATP-binding protein [Ilumatobacter sp.]
MTLPVTTDHTLNVSNLHVTRGDRPVLHGVSLDVPPGEITALLGPNGAGKSTLVLAIGGVLKPTTGAIRIGDRDLTKQKPEKVRAAGVAVVPEGRRLLPNLTVADNLKVATYSLPGAEAEAGISGALDLFPELNKRMTSAARSLSGGEQQMVVIAQALASSPKTLVVDELSLGLAPVVVKRMMPVLERVAEGGVGVLLIEQFAHVALALAQTAHVIEGGRIHYSGTAAALADDPELLKQAYLLGA